MKKREQQRARFLEKAGWQHARMAEIAGDASFRHYTRLTAGDRTAVLMDAPPEHEDTGPFITVTRLLGERGLSAPDILARDSEQGFLLLEDLGDALFSRLMSTGDRQQESRLYRAAMDVLVALQAAPLPATGVLPPYDAGRLLDEAGLFAAWYLPEVLPPGAAAGLVAGWRELWQPLLSRLPTGRKVVVLRDYHADNLIWLEERRGIGRVGLLDYQDAVIGAPAYDVVSLMLDARRDVAPSLADEMIAYYLAGAGQAGVIDSRRHFMDEYALLGAQRSAKVIGIFTRLWRRDAKPGYLPFIPRVWAHFELCLAMTPALAPVADWLDRHVPQNLRHLPVADKPGAFDARS